MVRSQALEPSIQRIEQSLAKQARHQRRGFFHEGWWRKHLLDWGTRDEALKVQLFRFIDVLPTLKQDPQFIHLLNEYFGNLSIIPAPLRWFLKQLALHERASHLSTMVFRRQFLKMAETFMAGHTIEEALPVLRRLWTKGSAFSIDLLGEATVSEAEAEHYRDWCLHTLQVLRQATPHWPEQPILEQDHLGFLPRIQLSLKLSALYSQLDPIDPEGSFAGVASRLRPILDVAKTLPAGIVFDMEQAEFKELTAQIFMRLFSEEPYRAYPHAGIALQAYLTNAGKTLDQLLGWVKQRGTPISIRLVKGAYWDSETVRYQQRGWPIPVFLTKPETDMNYDTLAQQMLNHTDLIRPAFGTHNIHSLAHAEALAETANLPRQTCEYQMLYGMADSLRDAVIGSGLRMRVYTPIGDLIPGMAYLVRRLLENTSNESILRHGNGTIRSLDHRERSTASMNGHHTQHNNQPKIDPDSTVKKFHNEPHTDFSQPGTHEAILAAIAYVRKTIKDFPPFSPAIGPIANDKAMELTSVNPSRPEEVIARFHTIAPQDIDPVIQKARDHCPSWRATDFKTRAEILFRTATRIRARRAELIAWEILETGKPWKEADADVAEAIDFLEFYGRDMIQLGQPRRLGHEPGELNHLIYEPRGLFVILPPWNFSLAIPTGLVSAALVTGNIVLFKPSERSPMMGYQLMTLFKEAGLPEGVLYFLPGGPDLGRALVGHPQIHGIAFTGSQDVGLQILAQASHVPSGQRHVKHVIAEMGGKNAIIVDETADLDEAVTGVLASAMGYQGQKCSACSRVIVLETIEQRFTKRLKQAALSIQVGPPENPANRMGPLIDERALAHVRELIAIGKQEGICLLDRRIEGPGYFQGPVIFTDIVPRHRIAQEEIFGPVLALIRAKDFPSALQMANDSSYALSGGIYSRSPANIQWAREEFDVGNLYINRPITGSLVGRQPFGGHRLSGIGMKTGGEGYLQQFMITKVLSENTLRRGFAPVE